MLPLYNIIILALLFQMTAEHILQPLYQQCVETYVHTVVLSVIDIKYCWQGLLSLMSMCGWTNCY